MTDLASIDPSTTAIVTVDVQPTVLSRFTDTDALIGRIRTAIDTARTSGARARFVRVFLTADDAAAVSPRNKMFGHFATMTPPADGPQSQVDSRLVVAGDDEVFTKVRMGSFSTTNLHEDLRTHGIDTIVLAGIATSGAVLSTAREAADLDYRVVVLSDCCADFDPEVHRVLTEQVLPMTSEVIDLAAFREAITA